MEPLIKKDLVLTPRFYCHTLDSSTGIVLTNAGTVRKTLEPAEKAVLFDKKNCKFIDATLEKATLSFVKASKESYVVLENPVEGPNEHPSIGTKDQKLDMSVNKIKLGSKINIEGPISFALWPEQFAKEIDIHQLSTSQYLKGRVYDKDVIYKQSDKETVGKIFDPQKDIENGQTVIIKGTDFSNFCPFDGLEIVLDEKNNSYVRNAVILKKLDYCILVDENGEEQLIKNKPENNVIFPAPGQDFVINEEDGSRIFKQIMLDKKRGIHVKVICDYEEGGEFFKANDELFITNEIYCPRPEHQTITDDHEHIHHAVEIPKGQGRYVMNKLTGEVTTIKGPQIYLADPRDTKYVTREMTLEQMTLLNSNNPSVDDFVHKFIAVRIDNGDAIKVVNSLGNTRIETGLKLCFLEYDEDLAILSLSKPLHGNKKHVVYLHIKNNIIKSVIECTTKDFTDVNVEITYKIDFMNEHKEQWFDIEDYTGYLRSHMTSFVKSLVKNYNIRFFCENYNSILKDRILGELKKDEKIREGYLFKQNGMKITDIDVEDLLSTNDSKIFGSITNLHTTLTTNELAIDTAKSNLKKTKTTEPINCEIVIETDKALELTHQKKLEEIERKNKKKILEREHKAEEEEAKLQTKKKNEEMNSEISVMKLLCEKNKQDLYIEKLLQETKAKVNANQSIAPGLIAALNSHAYAGLATGALKDVIPLSIVEGKSAHEALEKIFPNLNISFNKELTKS